VITGGGQQALGSLPRLSLHYDRTRDVTRSILDTLRAGRRDRAVLLVVLVFAWLNFLLTVKWAYAAGSLNGWKRPWYALALTLATVFAISNRRLGEPVRLRGLPGLVAGGCVLITAVFLSNFPPASWPLTPFNDDWPPRFQSTVEAIALLKRGAVAGWQWGFLGGYQTSADLTQNLMPVAAVPMLLFGNQFGFHLAHALLMAAIPAIVFLDIRAAGRRDHALLTAFFALICTTGMSGTLMPSGDTNSIAGVVTALIAMGGSRLHGLGWRPGGVVLAAGLSLALYSHAAFFGYALIYLLVEAVYYRSWWMAWRTGIAAAAALASALPLYIELLAYPAFFITNNLIYAPAGIDWMGSARQIFYNVEFLLHPHRWYNDYLSLVAVFLLLFVWVAIRAPRSRAGFYAWAVVATMVLLRFNVRDAGYLFAREMHMLVALAAPPLAWFVLERSGTRRLAWALIAVIALYVQTNVWTIPHVSSVHDFDQRLVSQLASSDGNLILLEGSPHRDLDSDRDRRTERTPFDIHFESHLPEATGRRYFGQPWDGWHWTPYRANYLAGGAFRGEIVSNTPMEEFQGVLKQWGIRYLFIWSDRTRAYVENQPEMFQRVWQSGRWFAFEFMNADPRSVVIQQGTGWLEPVDQLAGRVHLAGVTAGLPVIVRMNYFPAWMATTGSHEIALRSHDGQLAFEAPVSGDYVVDLTYPARRGWLLFGLIGWLGGVAVLWRR
jgi:hypothetical protein